MSLVASTIFREDNTSLCLSIERTISALAFTDPSIKTFSKIIKITPQTLSNTKRVPSQPEKTMSRNFSLKILTQLCHFVSQEVKNGESMYEC